MMRPSIEAARDAIDEGPVPTAQLSRSRPMSSASAAVIPFPTRPGAPSATARPAGEERLPIQHAARLILVLSVGLWGAILWTVSWAVA